MNELDFKIPLTTYFGENKLAALNFEFPFDFNRRRCDLLVATCNSIIGIEIKSDLDNLDRLVDQLSSYYKCFNEVYVACGKKHYPQISKMKGRFGIIFISEGTLQIKRKAKITKTLSLMPILDMCDKALLEKYSNLRAQNKTELIMKIINNCNKNDIYKIYYSSIYEKTSRVYDIFISEKGDVITSEDITLLSLKSMNLGPF
ncbi:sce7726 family protein [Bacillus amyloliquefaciens]|nr:sce7726 family protein [Bacillus amyloliquefaciens]